MYVVDATCFDECFYSMWQLEDIIYDKSLQLREDSFNRHIAAFFEISFLKEVRIVRILSARCSANNGEMLIPKFQNKAIEYQIYTS